MRLNHGIWNRDIEKKTLFEMWVSLHSKDECFVPATTLNVSVPSTDKVLPTRQSTPLTDNTVNVVSNVSDSSLFQLSALQLEDHSYCKTLPFEVDVPIVFDPTVMEPGVQPLTFHVNSETLFTIDAEDFGAEIEVHDGSTSEINGVIEGE